MADVKKEETKVEEKKDESALIKGVNQLLEVISKAQILQEKSPNPNPEWAGEKAENVSEDMGSLENGTDYHGRIAAKVAKGLKLSAEEMAWLQENAVDKSVEDAYMGDPNVAKEIEVSNFLMGFAKSHIDALELVKGQILEAFDERVEVLSKAVVFVADALNKYITEDREFKTAMGGTVGEIGKSMSDVQLRVSPKGAEPARAPKSVVASEGKEETLSKGITNGTLDKMATLKNMEKSFAETGDKSLGNTIIKFESTGRIDPEVLEKYAVYKQ